MSGLLRMKPASSMELSFPSMAEWSSAPESSPVHSVSRLDEAVEPLAKSLCHSTETYLLRNLWYAHFGKTPGGPFVSQGCTSRYVRRTVSLY